MKIRAVDATRPGSSHDALIWYMSASRQHFLQKFESGDRGSWLLGDSGFSLEPFLITPYRNALIGTSQHNFNKKHSAARNIVERSIGNLKICFRCLLNTLYYEPPKVVKILNVCCALHNIRKHYNIEFGENLEQENEENYDLEDYSDYMAEGSRIRDSIAQSMLL